MAGGASRRVSVGAGVLGAGCQSVPGRRVLGVLCGNQPSDRPTLISKFQPPAFAYFGCCVYCVWLISCLGMTSTLEIRPGSVDHRDLAILERALAKKRGKTARLTGFDGHRIEIPGDLVEALLLIVQQLHTGNGVSIAALRAEVTTAEAADLLNVSRPFVIKLLETGEIPFRKVGTHRRVRLVDVLEYRDRQDAIANAALDNMVRQAEEHGLYD